MSVFGRPEGWIKLSIVLELGKHQLYMVLFGAPVRLLLLHWEQNLNFDE
jgi:hypothetical protein